MTLLIVDMQPEFEAYRDATNGTRTQIRSAIKRDDAIVVLEYRGSGNTGDSIRRALRGHSRTLFVTKGDDDGGAEALAGIKHLRGSFHNINIAGVNTCCCVKETVQTMRKSLPQASFTYHPSAVSCDCNYSPDCLVKLSRYAKRLK